MSLQRFLHARLKRSDLADNSARVRIVLADEDAWLGYAGWLELRLSPGSGRVRAAVAVDAAARASVEIGVAVALGDRAGRWDVWWTVALSGDLPVQVIHGDSLGLAAAVAARAALQGHLVPEEIAFTGRVDLQGEVDAVGLVALKAAAAAQAGLRTLVVPPDAPAFPAPDRLEARSAADLFRRLWPEHRAVRALPVLGALAAGPLLVGLGLLETADLPVRAALLHAAQAPLPATSTALVLNPVQEREGDRVWTYQQRRARLAPLVDALVAAGVASITLDRTPLAEDPSDPALADALRRAAAAGVPVVMALGWRDGLLLPASPDLRAVIDAQLVQTGIAEFETPSSGDMALGHLKARDRGADWVWHAAARTVTSWQRHRQDPTFRDGRLYLGATSVSAPAGRVTLPSVAPSRCLLWTEPGFATRPLPGCDAVSTLDQQTWLTGRAAVVGVRTDRDRVTRDGTWIYGVDQQAAAIESLAAGRSILPWSLPERTAIAALFSALPAAILAISAPTPRALRLALLGTVLGTLAALVGLARLGFAPDVLPLGFGFACAAWAGVAIRRWRERGR